MPVENPVHLSLGLDASSRGAALSWKKEGVQVDSLFPPNAEGLEELTKTHVVVTSIPASAALARKIKIPLKKERELDQVLRFQVEPHLPFPIEEGSIERIVHENVDGVSDITYIALKNQVIENALENPPVDPEVVTLESASLAQFTYFATNDDAPLFTLYIDRAATTVVASKKGKLIATHAFPLGKDEVHSKAFTQKVSQSVMSLVKQLRLPFLKEIVVTSNGALKLQPQLPSGYTAYLLKNEEHAEWALPIGNALNALSGTTGTVNFRKDQFSYPNPWKRLKKGMLTYAAFMLSLGLSIYFLGSAYLANEKDNLKQEWVNQLNHMGKDPLLFEKGYLEKIGVDHTGVVPLEALNNYTLDDLEARMLYLQKEIQSTPNLFALHPNIPRVSDLLAWLATHPQVSLEDEEKLKVVSLNYQLVKRPDMGKKQEKYQAKVELEFSSEKPKLAREFHDALIAPNDFVDPKGEIKWSTNRGTYKTSFFLKDKTLYPQ